MMKEKKNVCARKMCVKANQGHLIYMGLRFEMVSSIVAINYYW